MLNSLFCTKPGIHIFPYLFILKYIIEYSAWYMRVLEEEVYPSLIGLYPNQIPTFQDDGAPIHRSALMIQKRNELWIRHLPWVGQSPDCNPIENLWSLLCPSTKEDLIAAINRVWYCEIPVAICRNLVLSMGRRLQQVVRRNGFQTSYWTHFLSVSLTFYCISIFIQCVLMRGMPTKYWRGGRLYEWLIYQIVGRISIGDIKMSNAPQKSRLPLRKKWCNTRGFNEDMGAD